MRKSFALGFLFFAGCGSAGCGAVSSDTDHRDGSADTNPSNDVRFVDGASSEATVDAETNADASTVDTGTIPPPTADASVEDTRRPDTGGGNTNDAGSSSPDASVDGQRDSGSTPDTSVIDGPRADSPVGSDGPITNIDVRVDTGGPTPDVGGPIDVGTPIDVTTPPIDVGSPPKDTANDPGCTAESDQQFCTRLGKTCEAVSGADNCGAQRTANCGTCGAGKACVDKVCQTPVCPSFNYDSAVYQPFSITGVQEFIVAASPDGESVLYVQSPAGACTGTPVYLADESSPGSGTYTSRDITTWWTNNNRGWATIAKGGLTMITYSSDAKTFGETSRSALQLIDFGSISTADYTAVNGFLAGTGGTFTGAAVTADGLELYYGVTGISGTADGAYRSTRSAVGGAFSVGQRIATIDSTYFQVSAVSSDKLTLFVNANWAGYVYTRNSTSVEFSNPNGSGAPPTIQGWQHHPVKDCALFATYSPGGCFNQEIMYMTRQ